MPKPDERPIALTIAGSDSGGGAGIQADLKTFAAFGVHGTSAITCVTAQNPAEVRGIQAVEPRILTAQIEAIFAELAPGAIKTGMLYSAELIRTTAMALADRQCQLVIDPVMIATSGAELLEPDAIKLLQTSLFPLATLITPNLDEASRLTDQTIHSEQDAQDAAEKLSDQFGCAVLVKGGHRSSESATDILCDGFSIHEFTAPLQPNAATHGSGCTLAAAIAANLALGANLRTAIDRGKNYITDAIKGPYSAGKHVHLNHFPD